MHITYLYADTKEEWNCSRWRCHLLSNAINYQNDKNPREFPHTANMYAINSALDIHHPMVQMKLGRADVLVFQRNVIIEEVWQAMEYWAALGKIILVDIDDHYPAIPPSNPAHPFWIQNKGGFDPDPLERLKTGLTKAHALISPSHVILKDWEHVVPGYYWPNYPSIVDYEDLLFRQPGEPDVMFYYDTKEEGTPFKIKPRKDSKGQVVIGWGGSVSHVDSFYYSGVVEGLAKLMAEDERVVLKFCGNEERLNFMWEQLPEGRLIKQRGVEPKDWPKVIAMFDIGIAPLDMRPCEARTGNEHGTYSYDERRSWLKGVEYICAGVPWVATRSATYDDLARFGKLVDNGPDDWYQALKSRVDGLPHFRAEAQKNRAYGLKKFTQEANAHRLIRLYTTIGEETQAKQGLRLPGLTLVKGQLVDGTEVPDPPPPRQWTGDPHQAGVAPWMETTRRLATGWYEGLGIDLGDIELGETMEYSMVTRLNTINKEAVSVDDDPEPA